MAKSSRAGGASDWTSRHACPPSRPAVVVSTITLRVLLVRRRFIDPMADEAASRDELIEAEPLRKPRRGRPPGSKNKPKPPVVVTRESPGAMRPVVLDLAPGCDVAAALAAFARRRRAGVSVLSGRGAVAAVRLRLAASSHHSSSTAWTAVTLHGRFELLSLSGTAPAFSVTLAAAGGQVIGGMLAGEMTAAADGVVLVAATFGSAQVHRLGADGEDGGDGGREEEGVDGHRFQEQQAAAAASGGEVVAGGRTGGYGGGHVGHHAQVAEIALWGQTTSVRGPVNPLPQF
ncbi:hypothetical protein HU200_065558 [Digitaria exilis]|uniref:PPC domain-containing protein n=1 Tax=Digitaria exilis TaxID=1010633 RepID=A0A835A1G7_9POAL|nr:hypothetical protein HU200_065558 [Digitaria exilis]